MSNHQAPTREPKRGRGWRPRYGRAPALGALGLLCLYGVIHAARIPENSDRPHVTVLLGASIQLLSGAVFIATRQRWAPIFHGRQGNSQRAPWNTYGLVAYPLIIWLIVALYWMLEDVRPYIATQLLRACA
ncbi:MAG TPA: hypothetical protein VEX38_08115, partial [Fimbriimonadaceae bacterium]|nr:hypothetical protein [Fimbriimonadaceae bacterium]